jgi:uncharacterized protein YbjT (DUF2867 family)
VLARLSAMGVPSRALVRHASAWSPLPGVEVVEGDMLRKESLGGALAGVDRVMVISSSAADMVEVQTTFVDAAKTAGVRHVVKLSGIMPDLDSPFRFARMHGEIERHIEKTGVPFTHLRAGEFMHAYFRQVPNIVGKGAIFLPMEQARIASIDVGDIADVAALALTTAHHEGRTYRLTGPEANTMTEIAEKLSTATGKPLRYVDVPPDDAKRAQLANGVPPYTADALAELFAERRKGKESEVWGDVPALLGRPATTFAAFATRHAAIFRGEEPAPKV